MTSTGGARAATRSLSVRQRKETQASYRAPKSDFRVPTQPLHGEGHIGSLVTGEREPNTAESRVRPIRASHLLATFWRLGKTDGTRGHANSTEMVARVIRYPSFQAKAATALVRAAYAPERRQERSHLPTRLHRLAARMSATRLRSKARIVGVAARYLTICASWPGCSHVPSQCWQRATSTPESWASLKWCSQRPPQVTHRRTA